MRSSLDSDECSHCSSISPIPQDAAMFVHRTSLECSFDLSIAASQPHQVHSEIRGSSEAEAAATALMTDSGKASNRPRGYDCA